MADNEVSLEILVEIQSALGKLNEFEKKSAASLASVEAAFGGIKTAAAAAISIFAGFQVGKFLKSGIESAEKQEQALVKLATQLDQTGENTDEAVKQFVALGDELEKTTRFEDDAVIASAALAKSFGLTNDQAITLTKAATELAAVTGESLESATRKLALTYGGATGKLDEQIPALKALTKAQLANGDAIAIVLERYGGAAQREIETFSGSIKQTDKAFGNLAEQIATSITQSPVLISAIQALGTGFQKLTEFTEQNKETLDALVNVSVKGIAAAVPVAVDALGFFTKGFEALTLGAALAYSKILDGEATFVEAFNATIGVAADALLGFLADVAKGASDIPLLGKGLELIGVSAEDVSASIEGFRQNFKETSESVAKETEALARSTEQFAIDAGDKFDSFNEGFSQFSEGVNAVAQSIFDADEKVVQSAKKVTEARSAIGRGAAADSKEVEKLRQEAQKFLEAVSNDAAGEAEKLLNKRAADLAKVRDFFEKGVISAEQAAEAEVKIREVAQQKVDKIFDEEDAKYEQALKERLEKLKQAVGEAANNPFKFAISKLEIKPGAFEGIEEEVSASVGTLGKILQGKEGAKSLVSEGAGAFADAFIPGIGGAVGSIVGKLTEGPEATKQFIRGFIEGVPDIITAVAESIPVVVEALVDTLINKGGIVKIAEALLRAIVGEAIFKSIGKQLGLDFGDAFQAKNLGATIGKGLTDALPDFPALFSAGFEAAVEPIRRLFAGDISGALEAAIEGPFDVARASLPEALKKPFDEALRKLSTVGTSIGSTMGAALGRALPNFPGIFKASIDGAFEPVRRLFAGDIPGALSAAITAPFAAVRESLPAALRQPFDEAIGRLTGLAPELGRSIGGAFTATLPDFSALFAEAGDAFLAPIRLAFAGDFPAAVEAAFRAPIDFFRAGLPAALKAPFDEAIAGLRGALTGFLPQLAPNFAGAAQAFITPVRALFQGDVKGALTGAFTAPIAFFRESLPGVLAKPFDQAKVKLNEAFNTLGEKVSGLVNFKFPPLPKFSFPALPHFSFPAFPKFAFPELPELRLPSVIPTLQLPPFPTLSIPTPSWFDAFKAAIDKLSSIGGGGGGGQKKGPVTGIPGSPFARGGKVPPGFPRDTFIGRMSSNERVLTPDQDSGLISLLEDIRAGKLTAARAPAPASASPVQVILQIGERQLASVMVDLQRQGFRTA